METSVETVEKESTEVEDSATALDRVAILQLPGLSKVVQTSADSAGARRQRQRRRIDLSSFVFDDANSLARVAIDQLLKKPDGASPVYFHGPVGCGKTHLIRGIIAAFRSEKNQPRCVYMTAEQFTASFIEALDGRGIADFRRKCRGLSVLAIDDIQFLSGKRATLVEFKNTIETLVKAGRQVLLAGDRPLMEIDGFDAELISRIAGGLPCPLNYVQTHGRKKIIQALAAERELQIDDAVIRHLAANLKSDVRLLSGALNRIEACQLCGQVVDVDAARELIADLANESTIAISIRKIESVVSQVCGVEPKQLRSTSQKDNPGIGCRTRVAD